MSLGVEQAQLKLLNVAEPPRVSAEHRERVLDAHRPDLLGEQIRLVEKEYDGDVGKAPVVDDHLEDVARLDEPVGPPVLVDDLVELAGGDEEEDGRDAGEALEPLPALRALPADVDEVERDVADDELVLADALGRLARVQDV